MIERGAYRSIHCVLVDGPDFQAFSPGAKLVFYTLKMTLGPSGIDVVPALVATLVERTGADAAQIEKALLQLDQANWVKRERNVVWIVDGLRHEPAFSLANANHRQKIRAHLDGLPRLPIVDAFRAHYGIAAPGEVPSVGTQQTTSDPSQMASNSPSKMASKMASKSPSKIREREEGEEKGRGKTEPEASAARRRRGGDGHSSPQGKATWLTPFAEAWQLTNGGTMAAGKAVKALAKLVEDHGADEVLRRWTIYLAAKGEYASAPSFAQTWGRWERPVLRHERGLSSESAGTGGTGGIAGLSATDAARVEGGNLIARIRELAYDQNIPGQGSRRLIKFADVEALGADVAAALRTSGGVARVLKIDLDAHDLPFLVRDFTAALHAARQTAATNLSAPSDSDRHPALPEEAQSA